eukprot:8942514-Prorocentrum_lima.AAC.1
MVVFFRVTSSHNQWLASSTSLACFAAPSRLPNNNQFGAPTRAFGAQGSAHNSCLKSTRRHPG